MENRAGAFPRVVLNFPGLRFIAVGFLWITTVIIEIGAFKLTLTVFNCDSYEFLDAERVQT